MAFSRSRTRSWAVRSRFRMAASSAEAESSTSPLSSTLRSIRSRRAGAGSSSSRSSARCGAFQPASRAREQVGGRAHVSATSSSSGAVSRPPRSARPMGARTSRAPPMLACAWSSSSRTASSVWSCSSATWAASAMGRVASASSRDGPKAVSSPSMLDDGAELQGAQRARIGGGPGRWLSVGSGAGHQRSRSASAAPPIRRRSPRRCAETARCGPAGSHAPGASVRPGGRRRSSCAPTPKAAPRLPGPAASRTSGTSPRRRRASSSPYGDLGRAQQHRLGLGARTAHHVGAQVQPVDEVDVQVSGRAEHHRVARRPPARRVGGQVLRPLVGLDLDQAAGDRSLRRVVNRAPSPAGPARPPSPGDRTRSDR